MLIKTSKYPGWGKLRPRQWGPLSEVRAAVVYNAQKIYGIDPADIVGGWPTWEGGGNQLHSIAGVTDRATFVNDVTWITEGINLAGSNDSLTVPDSNLLDITGELTLLTRMRTTTSAPLLGVLGKEAATFETVPYVLYLNNAEVRFLLGNGSVFTIAESNTTENDGVWKSIAGRINSSDVMSVLVDGVQLGTTPTFSGTRQTNTSDFLIGKMPTQPFTHNGDLDFPLIFSRHLTSDQLRLFHDMPYGLIAQVTPPYIFDVGAVGTAFFQDVFGNMPASSGIVTPQAVFTAALAGDMPNPTGAIVKKTGKGLAGNMPTPSGVIVKKTGKNVSGNMPESSGGIIKKIMKGLAGSMPNATGNPGPSFRTSKAVAGIMGAITGIVNAVLNPVAVISRGIRLIGASFRKFLQ
jgi:hypothetical protein